ncbi:MAG TPA: hypothetical protein VFT98_11005, partial [Myxococcota bacterium]|nr:hypothetical protein [Myxococcota bacterium]
MAAVRGRVTAIALRPPNPTEIAGSDSGDLHNVYGLGGQKLPVFGEIWRRRVEADAKENPMTARPAISVLLSVLCLALGAGCSTRKASPP